MKVQSQVIQAREQRALLEVRALHSSSPTFLAGLPAWRVPAIPSLASQCRALREPRQSESRITSTRSRLHSRAESSCRLLLLIPDSSELRSRRGDALLISAAQPTQARLSRAEQNTSDDEALLESYGLKILLLYHNRPLLINGRPTVGQQRATRKF